MQEDQTIIEKVTEKVNDMNAGIATFGKHQDNLEKRKGRKTSYIVVFIVFCIVVLAFVVGYQYGFSHGVESMQDDLQRIASSLIL